MGVAALVAPSSGRSRHDVQRPYGLFAGKALFIHGHAQPSPATGNPAARHSG